MKKYKYQLSTKKNNRLKNLWLLPVIILFLSCIFLFFNYKKQGLRDCLIENICIEGTNTRVKNEILSILKDLNNYSLNNVDIYKVKEKIKTNQLIYEASITKVYPNTIYIKVIEYKSFFIWQNSNDEFFLVNSENKIIRKAKIGEDNKLILIKGGNIPIKASEEVRFYVYSNKELINKVKSISFNGYSWDLYLTNNIIVRLPEHNIGNAVKLLLVMDQKYHILSRNISYIDARIPWKLFIKQSNS